ncbi:SDR family oxidoreductase [Pontibacillus yanchengensis]|uniref:SDR family oxidoreductase n=2 Tax=Pontibacillus yanchengensis TaxID=462910 RepID=A0ACC7VE21_9BACI|nr:SDR family oxidoreductase [Pontibacillus yanchengensis]MYL34120.1 SDR family oxidoreductase [Pontibacillus yanchengensis]MYL53213.1 SDR family oxidoreductase [Pontibacillus yanchengensis]
MRHAIITAGSKGLGRKVAEQFLEQGYSVTVTYRQDKEKAESLYKQYPTYSDRIQCVQADVTNQNDLLNLVDEVVEKFGRIDVLVNNAGPYIFERKKIMDYSVEEWNGIIRGNLDAVFHLLKKVIPVMREQRFGRIITYGFQDATSAPGWVYRGAFAAAKTGLVSLTKTIAYEEAENGITANMISPGKIEADLKEGTIEESRKHEDPKTPVGRPGSGEDISRAIMFLCDDQSDMVTGSVIEVTGGVDVIHKYRTQK